MRVAARTQAKRADRQGISFESTRPQGVRGFMAKANQVSIPYLDPSVQHVGISKLRALNVTQLRELDKTLVIQDNDKPLAVLLKYEHFLAMQEKILKTEGE
jgi:hypothetical protein